MGRFPLHSDSDTREGELHGVSGSPTVRPVAPLSVQDGFQTGPDTNLHGATEVVGARPRAVKRPDPLRPRGQPVERDFIQIDFVVALRFAPLVHLADPPAIRALPGLGHIGPILDLIPVAGGHQERPHAAGESGVRVLPERGHENRPVPSAARADWKRQRAYRRIVSRILSGVRSFSKGSRMCV